MINVGANTDIAGKEAKDVIEWLKSHPCFGEGCLSALGGDAGIDKSPILYLTQTGTPFLVAIKKWFLDRYKEEIAAAGFIRGAIVSTIREQTAVLKDCLLITKIKKPEFNIWHE